MNKIFQNKYKLYENDIDKLIQSFDTKGKLLKDGRNKLKIFNIRDFKINIKAFKYPNIIGQIIYGLFRKSKAQRSFEYANHLLNLGIGTPQPIAYYEEKAFFLFKRSYYVSEHIDYDLTFRELDINLDYPSHEQILRAFTRFTFELHRNGIHFLDHNADNTLISIKKNKFNFYLVDLNRMKFEKMSFLKGIINFSKLSMDKSIISLMSDEYAKCTNRSSSKVFKLMLKYSKKFRRNRKRKRKLKLFFKT